MPEVLLATTEGPLVKIEEAGALRPEGTEGRRLEVNGGRLYAITGLLLQGMTIEGLPLEGIGGLLLERIEFQMKGVLQ